MTNLIPDKVIRLRDEWIIPAAVVFSFVIQVLLTFLAHLRKKNGSPLTTAVIWSTYLIADGNALYAVGLIVSQQTNVSSEKSAVNKQLTAFWASFLLLHLGGPDAITAFSLEDNELWNRRLIDFVFQLLLVVYVFFQSLPNEYWIPTVLMFFAGAFKYAERAFALHQACLSNIKRSYMPKTDSSHSGSYARLMEEYSVLSDSGVPVWIDIVKDSSVSEASRVPAKEAENGSVGVQEEERGRRLNPMVEEHDYMSTVLNGYNFFKTFKGLIVDHVFSSHERSQSRMFFFSRTAHEAFKVMEVELNFMYDALYTKMAVVHGKIGYLLRILCTTLIVGCFQQFASHPKHNIILFDKIVTYILLVGAVSLDLLGMFNLVFSDWAIIFAKQLVSPVLIRLPFRKRYSRWSNIMFRHSFIRFCLNERFKWLDVMADFLRIKDILDELKYSEKEACKTDLKEFIFEELKAKAKIAEDTETAKEIYSARGDWVLSGFPSHYQYPSILSSLSDESEYEESLLLWHIATELCYFTCSSVQQQQQHCKFCKVLSDYMLYLLVMRPTLMPTASAIPQIRWRDTWDDARKFFRKEQLMDKGAEVACRKVLEVHTVVRPKEVEGDSSKSLFFDACILANDLEKLTGCKWELMSRVWVELLSYAASHCKPTAHARLLSQGGELFTFVWLLMIHFGFGEQFKDEAGHARAKLLVGK